MRSSRKLQNLNVWQQGIEQHRAGQRSAGQHSAGQRRSAGSAPGGWAKAFFRRLLGRRVAAAKDGMPSQTAQANSEHARPRIYQEAAAPLELREGMLSRRAFGSTGQVASPQRMSRAESINVSQCRDLRFWRRGPEFVAAARGGFDTGAGPEHALQRRAYWRQRSQRRSAATSPGTASKAAQSLRLLLRRLAQGALASRQGREELGQTAAAAPAVGAVNAGGRSRKTANKKPLQPIAAAAGTRRNKSFRDQRFSQQGVRLLEKALRTKRPS